MALKVIGAGVGRTGTHSLKVALEMLLGKPCYHMVEVFQHMDHVPMWDAASKNEPVDWDKLFEGYAAAVDWPTSAYWRELSAKYPDALVLLSKRSPESWWDSAHSTIFVAARRTGGPEREAWLQMIQGMFARFSPDIDDRETCITAFNRHNAEVVREVPPERLLVWEAKDGWAPICKALNLPIPDAPFPLTNTKEEFNQRVRPAQNEEADAALT
jgi:hypothetical protein